MTKEFLLSLSLLLGFCSTALAEDRVIKVINLDITSYKDALVLAKSENKKIFLYFSGEYCHHCQRQKEVFIKDDVVEKLKNYIICYVDLVEDKEIANKYNVRSVPSYFIIDENEKIIKKNTGYKDSSNFLNWLQEENKGWFR